MHPVARELAVGRAAALGDFVFVMGEDEVNAATVEIEGFAKIFKRHGGAFEVPAGSARTPGAFPLVVAVFGFPSFPEGEVGNGVFAVFVTVVGARGGAGSEFAFVEMGEFAVIGEGTNAEVDGAVGRLIGMITIHEGLNHGDLMGDVLGGTGLDVGGEQVEGVAVGMELGGPVIGEIGERFAGGLGVANGFVVDVGDVAHMRGGCAAQLKDPAHDVLIDEGAEVPDVGGAVDRGTAAVESQRAAISGGDGKIFAGEGVVKMKHGHGGGQHEGSRTFCNETEMVLVRSAR